VTLGIAAEKDVTSKHEIYLDSKATAAGTTAFRELMATSYARSGGVPAFQLLLLKDDTVNAFSTAGGRVFVNRGMLPLVGEDHGLWAAVIAHEVGHVVAHHQYKHYMRTIELKLLQEGLAREAATGNKVAQWAWIFSKTGGPLLNMKFSRNEENEADRLGLMMMAEAGYHPAYVLELMDRVKKVTGEKGKVGTFQSSDHPRWESREKKVKDSFDEALRIFNAKWPEPASSPGGAPPR
jgi:predicted Zn-dependent protease